MKIAIDNHNQCSVCGKSLHDMMMMNVRTANKHT